MCVSRTRFSNFGLLAAILLPPLLVVARADLAAKELSKKEKEALLQEEQEDYYKKWLEQDVVYVITEDEKGVFRSLTTAEEKEQFIEQFWYRRDPDPRTSVNEFKAEHYRRIAYANERFYSGKPGWQTDRGRIYIIHGEPAQIEDFTSGSTYVRPFKEGGGMTRTYPFQKWRYRYIEGIGPDVVLEFVDRSMSGDYRLSFLPEDKDALLHVPGTGLTLFEEMTGRHNNPYRGSAFHEDRPFARYYRYSMVQRAVKIQYEDLKEIVNINVSYNDLPFQIRQDYIRLNEEQVLVPITLEIRNKDLTFEEKDGVHVAKVGVYGIVTSITNRIITEFEDDMITSLQPRFLQHGLAGRSLYQNVVPVNKKMRYKLDLVVKDIHSGNVGVLRRSVIPPSYDEEKLSLSSLILSDFISPLPDIPREDEMFVLGDVKIRPSLSKIFPSNGEFGLYLQVYNAGIDQTTLAPSLQVGYQVMRGDQVIVELSDESGEAVQFFSGQRVVLIKKLPLERLSQGKYQLVVEVQDRIKKQRVTARDRFQVSPPFQMVQGR